MLRKVFVFLLVAAAISGLVSCHSNQKSVDTHNSKISLDWAGVYTGTIPSASGSGIDVRLKLNQDQTYELRYEYVGKPDNTFTLTGSFKWNDTGDTVNLGIADTPSYYKIAENKLIQLDMKGNLITGNLTDDYVLKKER